MRIVDCEQRSPEWYAARLGIPTASEFGNIITPARMQYAAAADTYINQLLDETFRPEANDGFQGNRHTDRGCELEPEALDAYAFEHDQTLTPIGFALNDAGTLGCSPDAGVLGVGTELVGGVEAKCPDGKTHIAWWRAGGLPAEHRAQVHGSLIVTGLPWWDFISYCPPYPLLVVRVVPDPFTDKLRECLAKFLQEYGTARDALTKAMS